MILETEGKNKNIESRPSKMNSKSSATPRNVRAKNRTVTKGFDFDHHRKNPSISSSSSNSSSSSSFYCSDESSPLSPSTPLKLISGIPFSWEKLPGIPKRHLSNCRRNSNASAKTFLPLPPSSTTPKKQSKSSEATAQWDPFTAAFVECSRDDDHDEGRNGMMWGGPKVSRSISDRFGFISIYGSCKRISGVSESSIIYIPGSSGRLSSNAVDHSCRHRRSVDKLST